MDGRTGNPALPEDGFPVSLRIDTQVLEKEEHRYTFAGQARLGETSYRVEGFEESLGNVH